MKCDLNSGCSDSLFTVITRARSGKMDVIHVCEAHKGVLAEPKPVRALVFQRGIVSREDAEKLLRIAELMRS